MIGDEYVITDGRFTAWALRVRRDGRIEAVAEEEGARMSEATFSIAARPMAGGWVVVGMWERDGQAIEEPGYVGTKRGPITGRDWSWTESVERAKVFVSEADAEAWIARWKSTFGGDR